jgi:catechol-2,3-dioxygenase
MAKLRHIALSVQDMAVARKFFIEAFDLQEVGQATTAPSISRTARSA